MTDANLSLTEAELSCLRDVYDVTLADEDDETLIDHGQDPAVVVSLGRKVERAWRLIQDAGAGEAPNRCPDCGGPLEGWAGEHHGIQCEMAEAPTAQTALEDLQVALENVARVIDAHGDVDTGQGQDEPHYSLEAAVDYLHEAERKLEAEGGRRPTLATFLSLTFDVTGFTDAEVDALTGETLVQGERSDEHPEAPVVAQSLTHKQAG